MLSAKYLAITKIVLDIEGPDSDDPKDPGGLTRFGIALKKHPELTREALLAFTRDDALIFIWTKYYYPHRCDEMPWKWALAVFDGEVNQGSVIKYAQMALPRLVCDGVIGDRTIDAMKAADEEAFRIFLALRLIHYSQTVNAAEYEKGWFARVIRIAQQGEHPQE